MKKVAKLGNQKKITLHRETLRHLDSMSELTQVVGGNVLTQNLNQCTGNCTKTCYTKCVTNCGQICSESCISKGNIC